MMTFTSAEIISHSYRGKTAAQRFWAQVEKGSKSVCWNWAGCIGLKGNGYGMMHIKDQLCVAHRVSWLINRGDIPKGLLVLHRCDNKRCVNPLHLFIGTHKDNLDDARSKGRWVANRGSNVGTSKLTEKEVKEIRTEYARTDVTQKVLGQRYNVTEPNIKHIIDGKAWKHVGGPTKVKKHRKHLA